MALRTDMKGIRHGVLWMVAGLLLAGCNNVRGLGKDIEKGGEAIQRAVK